MADFVISKPFLENSKSGYSFAAHCYPLCSPDGKELMGVDVQELNMSYAELVSYMRGYISRLNATKPESDKEALFYGLQNRLFRAIAEEAPPVYKVSKVDTSCGGPHDVVECETRYFYSLNSAKKDLKRRFNALCRSGLVATPPELQMIGNVGGICPDTEESIITNHNMRTRPPGRFKIYEVRLCETREQDDGSTEKLCIVPVQLILSQLQIEPRTLIGSRKKAKIFTFPLPENINIE